MGLVPARDGSNIIGILVVCNVFWVIAVIAVGLRIWSRRIKKIRLCTNDYAIFIALVSPLLAMKPTSFDLLIVPGNLLQCGDHDMYVIYDKLQSRSCLIIAAVLAGGVGQHLRNVDMTQVIIANKARDPYDSSNMQHHSLKTYDRFSSQRSRCGAQQTPQWKFPFCIFIWAFSHNDSFGLSVMQQWYLQYALIPWLFSKHFFSVALLHTTGTRRLMVAAPTRKKRGYQPASSTY